MTTKWEEQEQRVARLRAEHERMNALVQAHVPADVAGFWAEERAILESVRLQKDGSIRIRITFGWLLGETEVLFFKNGVEVKKGKAPKPATKRGLFGSHW